MMPIRIWTTTRPLTTQKYLMVAICEGVGVLPINGSSVGSSGGGSSLRPAAYQNAIPPMPASSITIDSPVHTSASEVGRLSISGSCGQLLVYVMALPGRFDRERGV